METAPADLDALMAALNFSVSGPQGTALRMDTGSQSRPDDRPDTPHRRATASAAQEGIMSAESSSSSTSVSSDYTGSSVDSSSNSSAADASDCGDVEGGAIDSAVPVDGE